MTEVFFRLPIASSKQELRLNFVCGYRQPLGCNFPGRSPAKHLLVTQSSQSKHCPPTHTSTDFPARRFPLGAGPQRGPETICGTPKGYPFKVKAAAPTGVGAPVRFRLAVGAEAPKTSKGCRSRHELTGAGAGCRAASSRPRRWDVAGWGWVTGGRAQSNAVDCWRAQRRAGCSGTPSSGSGTCRGIAV